MKNIIVVALLLFGVSEWQCVVAVTAGAAVGTASALPGTYVGDLPCADCPAIRYTLLLQPDGVFLLRMTYVGKGQSFDDIGNWSVSEHGKILTLEGGRGPAAIFAVKGDGVLRKLDTHGRDIRSQLNYDLKRVTEPLPIEPKLPMRGIYRYFADAGIFVECLTRLKLPAAQAPDNATLERTGSCAGGANSCVRRQRVFQS
jgi:copper homeostasis protein (lipoprotein)